MRPLALLLLLAALASASARAQAPLDRVDRRLPLAADGSIRIYNPLGTVRVTGWEWDSIAVSGTVERGSEFFMGGGTRGVKLFAGNEQGPATRAELEVRVPLRSKVWIKGAETNVEVVNFNGGLDVYSVTGSIRIGGSPSQVYAESMDGDVEVAASTPWVRAKSAGGTVTLRGVSDDAAASTVSGAIVISGGRFQRGRFESVSGDIRFEGELDRGGSFQFESHSGAIELRLPSNTSADIDVTTFHGEITNRLSRDRPGQGRDGQGRRLAFTVGQGGADLLVRTFKGPVQILAR